MAIFTQGSIMPSVLVSTGFQEANEDAVDGIVDGLERCAGWLGNRTGDYLDLQ